MTIPDRVAWMSKRYAGILAKVVGQPIQAKTVTVSKMWVLESGGRVLSPPFETDGMHDFMEGFEAALKLIEDLGKV